MHACDPVRPLQNARHPSNVALVRILLVEDDRSVARLISTLLSAEGFAVDVVHSGEEGRVLAFVNPYEGILLDLALGDRHGLTIVQELRREGRETPILVLTGAADEGDIVRALDAGADDYVVKPMRTRELVARVRALVRRSARALRSDQLAAGDVALNRLTRAAHVAGELVPLTPKEFALLEYFLLHMGEAVTRADLLEHVWDQHFDPGSNVVDVQVARLRRKLEERRASASIETVRGVGFRLVSAAASESEPER